MSLRKSSRADLHRSYPVYVEIGLVAALILLIVAFRADLSGTSEFDVVLPDHEPIVVEEITQTQQIEQPPPPPKPPVPIEVPNDEILEDEALNLDASLELDAPMTATPPPPPRPEDEAVEPEPEFFMAVEKMPEPVGGMAAIYAKANSYPEMARRAGVEGMVTVTFIVDVDGNVTNAEVINGPGAGLDEVALEAVRATKFTPGMQRDRPVPVKMSIGIRFSLR